MKTVEEMEFFPLQEQIVDIIVKKTQKKNHGVFRILVAYYLTKMASMMRTNLDAKGIGVVPINFYGINLSASGTGKGHSTAIIEEQIINKFKEEFKTTTFPELAVVNIQNLANKRSARSNKTPTEMEEELMKEFNDLGPLVFGFDSGTSPAVKQMRHKLLMAGSGSINLEIDEIGSNLMNNTEVLATFLELFDGKVKQKLIKNTSENKRSEEIDGKTPTNMMLYGAPSKLLNGGKTEDEFYSMLDTGYARRSFFGYAKNLTGEAELTPEEIYDMLIDQSSDATIQHISDTFERLADKSLFDSVIDIEKPVMLKLLQYKIECERAADELKDFEEIQRTELVHRYYKAMKLAGAYAFIEGNRHVTEDNLYAAIKLAEESGASLQKILTRPRVPERIARYLANVRKEVTQVDLMEDLPFYRGSATQRKDIMTQAIAWGYRNNIVIRTSYAENIEFFKGESMEETKLSNIKVSYSNDIVHNYEHVEVNWEDLFQLVSSNGFHYAAHEFKDGYRTSDNAIEGFNLLILDVDSGTSLSTAQMLLKDYTALFATTKRHTDEANRFRIVLPLSHTVKLSASNYAKFMENVFEWLPFDVDKATKDIARKWESYDGEYAYQEGELIDALAFIPDTRKQTEQQQRILDNAALSNLERWFLLNSGSGSRNNTLIKYAYVLVDAGHSYDSVKSAVFSFNSKTKNPLSEDEIERTIMVTVLRAITKRDNQR